MRSLIGLLIVLALAGCNEPVSKPGKKYLFSTDRCTGVGPADSPEYKACQKKQAEEAAQRMYDLKQSGTIPEFLPPPPSTFNVPQPTP